MNKYYANKEMALPFRFVYDLDHEKESIIQEDYLRDLFRHVLFETESRITGAELLLEKEVGSIMDINEFEDNDYNLFLEYEPEDIIYDESCQLIARKRLEALKVFHDAINDVYDLFYNNGDTLKDLDRISKDVKESQRKHHIIYDSVEVF